MRRCCPATRPWTRSGWRPGCARPSCSPGPTRPALRRLVRQLRARPFDLVVDVQGLLKSAVWVALARSPRKVGYDRTRELSYLALTERVQPFDPEAHAVRRYLNLAHYLGAPPALPRFRLGLDAGGGYFGPDPGRDRPAPGGAPSRGPLGLQTLARRRPGPAWRSGSGTRASRWPSPGAAADRELAASLTAQCRAPLLNLAGPHLPGPACRRLTKSPVGRHHRHRGHAPGRSPGDAGGGALRPHRALAHRPLRRRPPGGAPGAALQPLLQAPLPRAPVPHRPHPGNG